MRNYETEITGRTAFIREILEQSGAKGIVYGNSGGKDSALVGILCKLACPNTVGIIMPCSSKRNYGQDMEDAVALANQYDIETKTIDLASVSNELKKQLSTATDLTNAAVANIAPRLRMTTLYVIAASENRLVAGTGNRSESYVGYFTKWGDGAYDFNPIADLTVTEIYEFLRFLNAPEFVITKAPSGGLFDGQTDEAELGVTYNSIDNYLLNNECPPDDLAIIEKHHRASEHKRRMPVVYKQ